MIRDFFYLRKSDRQTLLLLLAVAVAALAGIYLAGNVDSTAELHADADSTALAGSAADSAFGQPRSATYYYKETAQRSRELFDFDPNTADSTQLLRLGLQPWQVRNIYKYRAAGGVYQRKQDFARLYGLTAGQYKELEPYIHIAPEYQPAATVVAGDAPQRDTLQHHSKLAAGQHVVLNTADTTELRRVPGIGVYFAKQIYRYGQRLGGYVSVDQLDEIDDLPAGVKNYFVIEDAQPQRLNVNRLSLNELKRHPYINFYQAKTICDYRRVHGDIRSIDELSLSADFPPEAISRLKPYVEY